MSQLPLPLLLPLPDFVAVIQGAAPHSRNEAKFKLAIIVALKRAGPWPGPAACRSLLA